MEKIEKTVRDIDLREFRTISGFILATSFSMIVFLLSLIGVRDIYLDLGITFLFFTVIILFDLYISSMKYENQISSRKIPRIKILKISKWIDVKGYLSLIFFYLGLLFLIYYFNLIMVFIPFTIYLWIKGIGDVKTNLRVYSDIKEKYNSFKKDLEGKIKQQQDIITNPKENETRKSMLDEGKETVNTVESKLILAIIFLIFIIIFTLFLYIDLILKTFKW
ncbi:hypothetical protein LCGC14_0911270 [marine sediment metagenome]|uniref:Uncharacterized protein n=1 Tax=marine sediment metagenome TaxID=412755 RepID=A0A0F9PED7_9ZZZZ